MNTRHKLCFNARFNDRVAHLVKTQIGFVHDAGVMAQTLKVKTHMQNPVLVPCRATKQYQDSVTVRILDSPGYNTWVVYAQLRCWWVSL